MSLAGPYRDRHSFIASLHVTHESGIARFSTLPSMIAVIFANGDARAQVFSAGAYVVRARAGTAVLTRAMTVLR